jgi:hypothetical protein
MVVNAFGIVVLLYNFVHFDDSKTDFICRTTEGTIGIQEGLVVIIRNNIT